MNVDISVLAIRALNLLCIFKLELAQRYIPLLIEIIQNNQKDVMIEAFKACINCIMAFSLPRLINTLKNEDSNMSQLATNKILSVKTGLLDHEEPDVYTVAVEGDCSTI